MAGQDSLVGPRTHPVRRVRGRCARLAAPAITLLVASLVAATVLAAAQTLAGIVERQWREEARHRLVDERSTALFQLATELPAAILARMLGIHINVAWQRATSGDWTAYAAAVSRRDCPGPGRSLESPRADL